MKLKTVTTAKSLLAVILFLFINISLSNAQVIRCATMEMDSIRRANNPDLPSPGEFEDWLNKEIIAKKKLAETSLIINGVYQIPVIVHVIHDGEAVGTGTNISQAVIQSQIDVLNEDFRRIFGTNGWNTHPDGADTQIEFCLAKRRPDGSPFPGGEDGINRIDRSSQGWGAPPYATAFIDGTIKPYTIATQGYDAADYMNFWSVDISGGILGYAQFPTTVLGGMGCAAQNVNTDGVVMDYATLGKAAVTGFPGPYNEGRTATHEIGHWLGLRHIWGDGGCGVDDYCADTPLSDASNFGCPTTNSCTDPNGDPNDMVENYMDYTDDLCMNIFTNDQKMRMRTVLENSPIRASLITSDACIPPAVNDASIINVLNPFGDNCPGTINPEVTLRNRGSSNLTSATIEYTINGGAPVSFNWTGSIAPGAETNVTLPGSATFLGTHTLQAYSVLPNGVTDPDPTYDTTTLLFVVSNGYAPDHSEDFEGGVYPPDLRWSVINPNSDCYEWVGGTGVASDGSSPNDCALMTNYQNSTNQDEYMYTPIFILPCNAASAEMVFDVAYRKRVNGSSDRLRVEISLDCGNTWQATAIYDKQGNVLRTNTANFNGFWIPDASTDWRNEVIDLSPFVTASSQNIQFRFRATNAGNGGNLYVDNFEFNAVTPGEINVDVLGVDLVDGGAYDYGTVAQGSTTTATFAITNSGTTDLTLTAPISITGDPEFSLNTSFGTLTVPAGGSTTFSIDFNPTTAGTFNGAVSFGTNDCDESPFDFFLFGETNTSPPTAAFTANPTTLCQGSTVTYTDASSGAASWTWTFPGGTPASATGVGPHIITYNTPGTFNAQLDVTNAFGTDMDLQTNLITVIAGTGATLPISEGFVAATFPPTNWSINNNGNAITWVRDGGNGNAPTAGNSAVMDNFSTNIAGDEDDLVMEPADFTGLTSAQLQFDVAYARYNATYNDQLDVLLSTDCGQTYTTIYSAASTALATDPDQTGAYTTPATWRTETIDLTTYVGNPKVDILFRNISGYGQYLYLDNINLTGVAGCTSPDVPTVTYSPVTVCDGNTATLNITGNLNDATDWNIYTGSCGGTLVGTTSSSTFVVTPTLPGTTYYVRGEGGCTTPGACGAVTVSVTANDDATFNYGAAFYCADAVDPTPTISGTPGGTFTSLPAGLVINATTGVIDVSTSMAGAYTVTYTTSGACPDNSNVAVTITALDDASFNYGAATYCVNDADPTPTVTGLTGGAFTSSPAGLSMNGTTGAIDVSASTPGTYTVTYTTSGTCPNSNDVNITINTLDDASFSYSATAYCTSDVDPAPTITGLGGGTFSSPAGLSINGTTGAIDVSASTPGTYTVTYTTSGACSNSSNVNVTINTLDDASFNYSASAYCVSDVDPTPTVTGLTGGAFTSSPAGLSINGTTGAIDVSVSTPGTYAITYTTSGTCPNSSNVNVTINALDDASFSYTASAYCVNDTDPTPTVTGLGGGTFSSSSGLSINGTTGEVDLSASTPGAYTITYTTSGTCSNSSDVNVTVNGLDDASFNYGASSYCVSDADPSPTVTGLTGGAFTSSPAGLSINGTTGTIDVSTSVPGSYTITYTTSGTCPNSSNVIVVITSLDDASFNYSAASYCSNAFNPTPTITGVAGGTFTSAPAGLVLNPADGTINMLASMPGTYAVTYTTSGACANSSNMNVTINALDDASFNYASGTYCTNGVDPTPIITGVIGGTFTGSLGMVVNPTTGTMDLSAIPAGLYSITYTTSGVCPNSSAIGMVIVDADDASFNYSASAYCSTDADPSPAITGSGGGTFASSPAGLSINATTGDIDLSASAAGTYTVSYTTAGTCPASTNVNITVNASPSAPVITPGGATTFCSGGNVTLTSSQPTGNIWSTTSTSSSISVGTSGLYTVTYTDGNGCSATSIPTVVTVNPAPVIALGTVANPATCATATGSIEITGTGTGIVGWTGTATGNSGTVTLPYTITGLAAGAYTISFVDVSMCASNTLNQTLTDPTPPAVPTITASGPTTFCAGGSVDLTSSYATGNTWSTTETTQTINVTTSGTYSVTYTDGSGCSSTSAPITVTVNANPAVPVVTASGSTTFCAGGSVDLTSSEGSGNVWSTTETTQLITVSASGAYTVTYTDGNGCASTSAPTVVTVNPLPLSAPAITTDGPTTFCTGGSVNLTSSEPTGNTWSTTETTQTINVTTSGSYTVTYTDGNGCLATSIPTSVTVNPVPVIAMGTVTNPATCATATGSIQITGSGTGIVSWTGTVSGNSGLVTLPYTITGLAAGSYGITFDAGGCTSNVLNQTISDPSAPSEPVITASGATTFCAGGSVNLTSSYATGNDWSTSATTQTINVTTSGIYTVTYTDGSGCSATSNPVVVTVNANPAAPTISASGATTFCTGDAVDLTSSEPSGNVWSTSATSQTINATSSGSYFVTYTDGNGCSATSAPTVVTVNVNPSAPTITAGGATTFCPGGAVDLVSSQPTGNVWSTTATSQTITATSSGSYTVTYTDGNGCSATSVPTLVTVYAAPTVPTISSSGTTTFCDGGSVDLTSSQPLSNVWSTTATSQTINVTTSGSYTVTYTNSDGCSATSAPTVVTVNVNPTAPTITASGSTSFCDGGSVDLTSSQTTGNDWSTTETSQVITVSTAGSYTVTYTDGNGCSATSAPTMVAVNANPVAPVITPSGVTTFCDGGSVDLISSETSGNDWSTTETTQLITVSTSGSYTVTYTDGNGCSTTSTPLLVTVNANPAAPTISASGSTTFCSGGSVDLSSSQATGNVWSTTATTQMINVTNSGTYTVTYTDGNGCTVVSVPIVVTVNTTPTAPTISANGPTTFCDGDSVSLTSSQSTGNDWSTTETTQTITAASAGSYAVTYTDGNGCSATSAQIVVTVNALPSVTLAPFADICDHVAMFTLTGGTPAGGAYSGTGVSSGMFDPFVAGIGTHTITYTYTDVNGCTNTTQQDLNVRDCAGLDELTIAGLSVYPNPTFNVVNVNSTKELIEVVNVYDAAGRLVFAEKYDADNVSVNLSDYVVGVYTIEVRTVSGVYRTRVLKQ